MLCLLKLIANFAETSLCGGRLLRPNDRNRWVLACWQMLVVACFVSGAPTQRAAALSGFTTSPFVQRMEADRHEWQEHPFSRAARGLSLTEHWLQRGGLDLDTAVARRARELSGSSYLSLVPLATPEPMQALGRATGTVSRTYEPRIAGISFCGMSVRAHRLNTGELAILGALPRLSPDLSIPSQNDWPSVDEALARMLDELSDRGVETNGARIKSTQRCWQVIQGELRAAWSLQFSAADLPYSGFADADAAYRVGEEYFSVAGSVVGKAQVYQQNKLDNGLINADLLELVGDGTLSSDKWRIVVPDGFEVAKSSDHIFNYDPSDIKFVQPNLYYHVQLQYQFMNAIGYEWPKSRILLIKPHMNSDINVGYNNAFYQPPDNKAPDIAQIKLGDGDGRDLQNLGTDADVIAHEFGHQIVYETLRTAAQCYETLALHEGLADFFVFARTKDPCLGETICPEGTMACVTKQCLRTAEIDLKFGDAWWLTWSRNDRCYSHKNGQLFSGLLWDLRADGKIPVDDLARITLKAVSYFRADSGFRDFLLTLLMADKELFQGRYRSLIKAAADARGLGSFISDIALDSNDIPALAGGGTPTRSSTQTSTQTNPEASTSDTGKQDKEKKRTVCGVVGSDYNTSWSWLLIFVFLPLSLGLLNRWERKSGNLK